MFLKKIDRFAFFIKKKFFDFNRNVKNAFILKA